MNRTKHIAAFLMACWMLLSAGGVFLDVHFCKKAGEYSVALDLHEACCGDCEKNESDTFKENCCSHYAGLAKLNVHATARQLNDITPLGEYFLLQANPMVEACFNSNPSLTEPDYFIPPPVNLLSDAVFTQQFRC